MGIGKCRALGHRGEIRPRSGGYQFKRGNRMNIVNEVSSVLTEVESLRSEVKILREAKILSDFETDQLRRHNTRLQERVDWMIADCAEMKSIVDQTGAALVSFMNKFNERRREITSGSEEPRLIERAAE
jgi:hypothetical protein